MQHNGYGVFQTEGTHYTMHRVALIVKTGEVGEVARHKCDNRKCINPAHLEWGTRADNSRDMVLRGRSCKGEANAACKLSDEDVAYIRNAARLGDRHTRPRLAKQFGVATSHIYNICKGVKRADS